MKPIRVLGVMTGTSCDGIDLSCLEFTENSSRHLWDDSRSFPEALRKRVLNIQEPNTQFHLSTLGLLDRDLGDWYGRVITEVIDKHKERPDAIANHGQTVGHFPKQHVTIQLGCPSRIARATEITVISGFRTGDLAAGGQGAPLLPLYHRVLAQALGNPGGIAIHNIGGISNLTYIDPRGEILAFDTGPGNLWMDAATEWVTKGKKRFDLNGQLSLRGEVDTSALVRLMKIPFLRKSAPKSTGRDDFPFELLLKATKKRNEDLIATALWFTVETIAQAYEKNILNKKKPLQTILVCGGGAKNGSLIEALSIRMPDIEILGIQDAGIDPSGIESQGFAYFGFRSLLGLSSSGPWTGAKGWVPSAQIIPGKNWNSLIAKLPKGDPSRSLYQ